MAIVELSKTILEWSKNFGCSRRRNIPRQPFDSRSQVTVEMATKNRFVYSLTASSLCTFTCRCVIYGLFNNRLCFNRFITHQNINYVLR